MTILTTSCNSYIVFNSIGRRYCRRCYFSLLLLTSVRSPATTEAAALVRGLYSTTTTTINRSFLLQPRTIETTARRRCSRSSISSNSRGTTSTRVSSSSSLFFEDDEKRTKRMSSSSSPTWNICSKCNGNGKILRRLSSKKRRYKQEQQRENKDVITPNNNYKLCQSCDGSGLLLLKRDENTTIHNKETITTTKEYNKNNNNVVSNNSSNDNNSKQLLYPFGGVAIIGGGIGGLALGLACYHRNIPFRIYERDVRFSQRRQGYGLTLQQASKSLKGLGILSLKGGITSTRHVVHTPDGKCIGEWGLRKWGNKKIERIVEKEEQQEKLGENAVNNNSNEKVGNNNSNNESSSSSRKRQNIHIARQALRQELYNGLLDHEQEIQWGYRLTGLEEKEDHVQLNFKIAKEENSKEEEEITTTADIVVGADGIRSTVRKFALDDNDPPLRYLGCIVILGICPLEFIPKEINNNHPNNPKEEEEEDDDSYLSSLLDGSTVYQTADGTTRLYSMPFSSSEYMWQLSWTIQDEEEAERLSRGNLKDAALQKCSTWHYPIVPLLESTPPELISGYPVYDRTILQSDMFSSNSISPNTATRRITLLGDAAHPMSPFKGQGANQALLDALSLARTLYNNDNNGKQQKNITSVLERYEMEMIQRSSVKVKASADAAQFLHTNIAIQKGNITRGAAFEAGKKKS